MKIKTFACFMFDSSKLLALGITNVSIVLHSLNRNFLFGIFLSFSQSHSSLCSFEKNKNILKDKIINHSQSNL